MIVYLSKFKGETKCGEENVIKAQKRAVNQLQVNVGDC